MFIFQKKKSCSINKMLFDYRCITTFAKYIFEKWTDFIDLNKEKQKFIQLVFRNSLISFKRSSIIKGYFDINVTNRFTRWLTFHWQAFCLVDKNGFFSFRWNGSKLSRIIQSPIRWVVTDDFDLQSNTFWFWRLSMILNSVWQTLSGMTVVVTREGSI